MKPMRLKPKRNRNADSEETVAASGVHAAVAALKGVETLMLPALSPMLDSIFKRRRFRVGVPSSVLCTLVGH